MNNATNTCNHTEEIAHAIYSQHHNELNPGIPPDWDALPEKEKQAWRKVAGNILPTLGQHALGDLLAYAKRKIKESSSTGKKILWGLVSAAVLAALSWLASLGLTSCGHTVDISQEGAAIWNLPDRQGRPRHLQARAGKGFPPGGRNCRHPPAEIITSEPK